MATARHCSRHSVWDEDSLGLVWSHDSLHHPIAIRHIDGILLFGLVPLQRLITSRQLGLELLRRLHVSFTLDVDRQYSGDSRRTP